MGSMSHAEAVGRPRRAAWGAGWTWAALVALGLAALAPIGLSSSESADLAANAFGVGQPITEAMPLAGVLSRAATLAPIGEVGARPHAVAVLSAAAALAFLLALLRSGAGDVPSDDAVRSQRWRSATEHNGSAAVAVGLLLVAVSRPFLAIATVRPGGAVDFALIMGILVLVETVRSDTTRSSVGLGLAFLCGLAAGAGWPIRAAMWPVATAVTIWALRRGERWPLLAPTLFVAGGGVALGGVVPVAAEPPVTLGLWLHQVVLPRGTQDLSTLLSAFLSTPRSTVLSTLGSALSWVVDDIGVLAALAVAVGCWALVWTRSSKSIFCVLLLAAAAAASLANGDVLLARLMLIAAAALPITRGHAALAQPFGRARGAAAIVLGVVIVLWPAVVGIGHALAAPGRRVPGEIARRLDTAAAVPRSRALTVPAVELSDREAARWWRYARLSDPWSTD